MEKIKLVENDATVDKGEQIEKRKRRDMAAKG